jgi:hypothetical protein
MKTLNRRSFLTSVGAGTVGAVLLAGCTVTTVGSTTTATLNVAKINAYITAGLNAANTVATTLRLVPALAEYSAPLNKAVDTLQTAAVAFSGAVGDKVEISYNDASLNTIVDSVVAGIQDVLDVIMDVAAALVKQGVKISVDTLTKVQLARDALSTVVAVFKALITTSFTSTSGLRMVGGVPVQLANSEYKALKTLGV